jgi:hypothetical protein
MLLVHLHFDCVVPHEVRHGIFYLCSKGFGFGAFWISDFQFKDIHPLLWTRWPKTTEIYSFIILEARNAKSKCQQGPTSSETLNRLLLHPLPCFWYHLALLGFQIHHSNLFCCHMAVLSLCVSVFIWHFLLSVCLFLKGHSHTGWAPIQMTSS